MIDPYSELEKKRKPRVHIKYEVETDGAFEEKEIPFTVGLIGDYAGSHPGVKPPPLKEREFIKIDKDNFDDVISKIKPGVNVKLPLEPAQPAKLTSVSLQFNSMKDFEPDGIIKQVPSLLYLQSIRNQLRDLLAKSDSIDGLEVVLEEVLRNPEQLQALADKLALDEECLAKEINHDC